MDPLLLYSILAGVTIVFLICAVRFALRWLIRFVLIGFVLIVLSGVAWWWMKRPNLLPDSKARPTTTRRASSDQR